MPCLRQSLLREIGMRPMTLWALSQACTNTYAEETSPGPYILVQQVMYKTVCGSGGLAKQASYPPSSSPGELRR